ncbi:MAG: PfkB family carbohydrate kinase, partial [Spirochaetaceae bacterium]|nr:PfkB family carbohydrate kinase [Spirochaetaceae bacterium]
MPRILDIGSLNIDEVFGVREFARAGETSSALGYAVFPGGKGLNQSVALARAGATVLHGGKVGEDGRFLVELLREAGVDAAPVLFSPTPTGRAFIQVRQDGQNSILLYGGANRELSESDI